MSFIKEFKNFINEYNHLLHGLENVISQNEISRNRALSDLERYNSVIVREKDRFRSLHMSDVLWKLNDKAMQIEKIDTDFFNLLTKCENLKTDALRLD